MIKETTEHMEKVVTSEEEVKTTEPISLNTEAPHRDSETNPDRDPVSESVRSAQLILNLFLILMKSNLFCLLSEHLLQLDIYRRH